MHQNLVLIAASFGVCLVFVELALRGFDFKREIWYRFDQYVGATLMPGAEGTYDKEGVAHVKINSHGFRSHEWQLKKPQGVYRIAILGDSYAEAMQVDSEETFWYIAQELLNNECPLQDERRVEVLNFGVSGHGTIQQLEMYRHHVKKFEPDLVVVAFLTGNDIRNNSKVLEPISQRPFADIVGNGLKIDMSFTNSPKAIARKKYLPHFVKKLRLYQLVNSARISIEHRLAARQMNQSAEQQGGISLDSWVYVEPEGPWKEAWEITEKVLLTLRAEVLRDKRQLIAVTLTNPSQVNPNQAGMESFKVKLKVESLDYPDRRLARFFEKHDMPFIILLDHFRKDLATNPKKFFHGFDNTELGTGHWNENGHLLAGEILAESICRTFFKE